MIANDYLLTHRCCFIHVKNSVGKTLVNSLFFHCWITTSPDMYGDSAWFVLTVYRIVQSGKNCQASTSIPPFSSQISTFARPLLLILEVDETPNYPSMERKEVLVSISTYRNGTSEDRLIVELLHFLADI